MTHQRRLIALAVTAAILAGACSGSDAADSTIPATEAPSTSSTIDPTTTEPTTTTVAATTTTSLSAATTTTATTTTTTTTAVAPVPVEQLVIGAALAAREGYLYAVLNVGAPDALDRLQATHAADGASLRVGLANYQELVDKGWRGRPNPAVPDTATVESQVEFIDDTTAELSLCIVNASVLYAPGAADDGSDLILGDKVEASLNRVTMVLVNGKWLLQMGTNLTKNEGETTCIPE